MIYKITVEQVNGMLKQIQDMPYRQVAPVIELLKTLEPLEEPKVEEKPKK